MLTRHKPSLGLRHTVQWVNKIFTFNFVVEWLIRVNTLICEFALSDTLKHFQITC